MEVKELHDQLHGAFDELKATLSERDVEVKKLGEETAETKQVVDKIDTRLDEIETKLNRVREERNRDDDAEEREAKRAEMLLLRHGMVKGQRFDPDERLLKEFGVSPEVAKALGTDVDADGGYLVPENLRDTIIEAVVEYSDVRSLATVVTIGKGDSLRIPKEIGEFAAAWVAQRAAVPATGNPTFGNESIDVHKMYAKPLVTEEMLEDLDFDVEGWLARRIGEKFARLEGAAHVVGTGSGQPEGVLAAGTGITGITAAGAAAITADELLDLVFELDDVYERNATFLLRRSTLKMIRKLKDSDGGYIWSPGLDARAPASLLGYSYKTAPDMPAATTGNKAVVFGDFRAGYLIVDRRGVSMLRDPYSSKPYVEFYTTRRTGGGVIQPAAFKTLTMA